jgi:murein DD-endopeptidase MepM/ murein hydrolase activator NlpD
MIVALAGVLALVVGLGGASFATGTTGPGPGVTPAAGGWMKPVNGELSSSYGMRCLGGRCRMHTGTDISVPSGTDVVAAGNGVVESARCASAYCDRPGYLGLGGYGNLVTVKHADGVVTRYAHLTNFAVTPGQQVAAGDLVGHSGSTGNSTGPHLHFEVKVDGAFTDPVKFLKAHGVAVDGSAA